MFLIKEPGGHASREEDSSAIPSDEHRDLCIKLCKDRKRSYEKQDHKKFNKTRLRKWGMPAIIEEVETDHNLVRGVLKANTLRRYIRAGFESSSQVPKRGQPPIFPPSMEENLLKLVLAAQKRGDTSCGE